MPPLPRGYEPLPYAGAPRSVPNYGTLGELMGLKARNAQQGWMQLASAFDRFVQSRRAQEQAQLERADVLQQRQSAEAMKREEIALRFAEREEAARIRREAAEEKAQLAAEKRGDSRAKAIGYGPMAEADVDTVLQSPERAGDVRYSFGPGTADGPELQPTQEQQRTMALEQAVREAGGTVGPNGSAHYPPKPTEKRPQPAMVKGRRAFVFFGADGTATDMAGRPVQAEPIGPEGPAPERPSVWLQKGTEQRYVTPSQATALASEGWGPSQTRENPTEDERKSAGFYKRMEDAIRVMDEVEDKLTQQDIYQIQSLPQEDLIGAVNRGQMSEPAKRYIRSMMQFTEARLRADSGAAIGKDEYANDRQMYAKQYSETPALNKDRRGARGIALEGLKTRGGRAVPKDAGKSQDNDPLGIRK